VVNQARDRVRERHFSITCAGVCRRRRHKLTRIAMQAGVGHATRKPFGVTARRRYRATCCSTPSSKEARSGSQRSHSGADSGRSLRAPSKLGGAAVLRASSASDDVHGTVLPVDGGWLAGDAVSHARRTIGGRGQWRVVVPQRTSHICLHRASDAWRGCS
jgi:hypothetical protein